MAAMKRMYLLSCASVCLSPQYTVFMAESHYIKHIDMPPMRHTRHTQTLALPPGAFHSFTLLCIFWTSCAQTHNSFAACSLTNAQFATLWNNTLSLYSQPHSPYVNSTTDWPSCIACGAIFKSLKRLNMTVPDVCKRCFDEHCWNGEVDDSWPGFLAPSLILSPEVSFEQWDLSFYASSNK